MTSVVMGSLFSAVSMAQGAQLSPRLVAMNVGGLYAYNVMQCPMEAIHGRESALHNAAAGGILGFMGVRAGVVGIPFTDAYFFLRHPQISPPLAGAAVYGAIGFILANVLGNKPM